MKKILILCLLVLLNTNICFADGVLDNVLNSVQAINYGVPPSEVAKDYAYQYAQQQAENQQQNYNYQQNQYQNNYYQTPQYQNQQYQDTPVNPYQNVDVDSSANQHSAPVQNPYVRYSQSYNGDFVITPFGNISFYDGLMDVINKLRAMPSVTEIYLDFDKLLSNVVNLKTGNLKYIPQEQLTSVVKAYLAKETANTKIYPFIDKNGKTSYYNDGYAVLKAKTIMLENTPFELSIKFLSNAAMAVHAPNKVLNSNRGCYPLYVSGVLLSSDSYLTKDNWQKINQACKNKFAVLLSNLSEVDEVNISEKEWQVHDKYSNIFSFEYDEDRSNCSLSYSSDNYKNYLDNYYKENLKKIDAKKYNSVPNSKI